MDHAFVKQVICAVVLIGIRSVVLVMGITVGPVAIGGDLKAGSGEEDRECLWYRWEKDRSCEGDGG